MTVAPASTPLPVRVGVVTLVMLSVLLLPESDALARSAALGAAGAEVSMVTVSAAEAVLAFPAASVALVVKVWAPALSVLVVMLQLPKPSAVVVPSTVVPSVSYNLMVAPASAPLPVMVGVVALVRLSELLLPVSEPDARSAAFGAAGAKVSMVTVRAADAALVLPAASVALVVNVWLPALSVLDVMLQLPEPSAVAVPSTVVPSVSYNFTVAPASTPLPVMVGVVKLVMLSALLAPVSEPLARSGAFDADGAVVSIVTVSPADAALVLPATSVTLVVSVCAPLVNVLDVMLQLPEPSAVAVPSTVVP